MTRATLTNVNEALATLQLKIELVKGEGYFYFAAFQSAPEDTVIPASVYVTSLRDLTLEEWVDAATTKAPVKRKSNYIRGNSTVMTPCARVHFIADRMAAEDPAVARKAIMAACMAAGVTYGTTRTQYQKWKNS